ncbi:MAG: hypothetical protein MJH10_20770 [Epibacterium sp.]|nr:hypothetical protein [Epibacterium sp.]NQX75897.1 hypothetical protein [Epibacterium sp.]
MSNAPERIYLRNGEVNKGQVSPFDDCYIRRDAITPAMAAEVLIDEINRPVTNEEKPDWRWLGRLDMPSLRAIATQEDNT